MRSLLLSFDLITFSTLVGVVDSEGDKTIAGFRARSVATVSAVNNDLEVATKLVPWSRR